MLDMPIDVPSFDGMIVHENLVSPKICESKKCDLYESDLSFFDMLATGLCSGSASSVRIEQYAEKTS